MFNNEAWSMLVISAEKVRVNTAYRQRIVKKMGFNLCLKGSLKVRSVYVRWQTVPRDSSRMIEISYCLLRREAREGRLSVIKEKMTQ